MFPKSEQKKIRHNSFHYRGLPPPPRPPIPLFRRGLRPLHPLHGLLPSQPGWKTIDWNSNQLVLMYYWSTFMNQVRFLNFRHFYDPIFKQISQASFFHHSNHFLTFYPLWRRKRILLENFPFPKYSLFAKLIMKFIANWLPGNIGQYF